jgi:tetratricopeptide (TPR) repeat protein
VFDDLGVVVENPLLRSWDRAGDVVRHTPLRAVVNLTFLINYQLAHGEQVLSPSQTSGADAWSFHLFSILFHALNACLVYLLTRALLRALPQAVPEAWQGRVALVGATVWALHPVQSMAVAYVAQRYALLAATAFLATCLVYTRLRLRLERGESAWTHWDLYGVVLVGCMAAPLCKENAAVLPLAILTIELLAFRAKRWRYALGPLGMYAAGILGLMHRYAGDKSGYVYAIKRVLREFLPPGSQRSDRLEYLITQVPVNLTYLRLWVFPDQLSVEQDYPILWSSDAGTWASSHSEAAFVFGLALAGHALIVALGALLLRRGHRLIPLAIAWYYLCHLVEGVVPLIDPMVEHRLYLPSALLGVAVAVAAARGLSRLRRVDPSRRLRRLAPFVGATLVSALGVGTVVRNRVWASEVLLWEDAVAKRPNCPRALGNLGATLLGKRRFSEAIGPLWASIELSSSHVESWSNLGRTYLELGHYSHAEIALQQAIKLSKVRESPAVPNMWTHLGLVGLRQAAKTPPARVEPARSQLLRATACFTKALSVDPTHLSAQANLAMAEFALIGRSPDPAERFRHASGALRALERLGQLRAAHGKPPADAEITRMVGMCLLELGRVAEGLRAIAGALPSATPQEAVRIRFDLALTALELHRREHAHAPQALTLARELLARAPEGRTPKGKVLRGRLTWALGDEAAALELVEAGVAADPDPREVDVLFLNHLRRLGPPRPVGTEAGD